MSDQPQPTKKERRETAKAERIEAEQRTAAAAARKKRLGIFGGLLVAAVAIVVVAIAISSSGDDKKSTGSAEGSASVIKLYDGVPQKGITLGDPKARATMVLFEDAQCPYCRDFEDREMPGIVKDLVRTGKLKVNMRLRAFLGEDSITAAKALYAASEQNKMFESTGILYANQGEENSGWVTEQKLREIFGAVPGLDVDRVFKDAKGPVPTRLLGEAETLATRYGSQSTPDVYVGTSENNASKVDPTEAAVKKAVAGIGG